jgi:two-component system sensor histidine kinase/response regulator
MKQDPHVQSILLVDDHPANLALLRAMLEPLGCRLAYASGGREAIQCFDAESTDLVLLDWVMPEVSGLEVLRHIRQPSSKAHVPVILVTAQNDRVYRLEGLEAGADDFIEKPVDRGILLARVRTLLRLKEANDALQASHDTLATRNLLLEQLRREQRELTQFIVHDLKNPLSVVAGNLELARERVALSNFAKLAEVLDEADDATGRIRNMVEDLLAIVRLEDANFPVRCEAIEMGDLLGSIAASFALKAASKGVALQLPSIDLTIEADPHLLRRVVENILDNAIRHTPQGGRIAIEVRREQGIDIRIANTGPPIPPNERGTIFEKFARGKSEAADVGNAGLGLYFCKRAVEAHGGEVSACETPEWPTCFVVSLPYVARAT